MDEIIRQIDSMLRENRKLNDISKTLNIPKQTLYARIKAAGYRITKSLEPINAKPIKR